MLFSDADKGTDSWKSEESKDISLKKFEEICNDVPTVNAILEMFTNIFLETFFIIRRKQALVLHEE